jgi:type II secretory pathway predicted ATPase ExeA
MLRAAFNLTLIPFTKEIETVNLFPHPQFDAMVAGMRFLFEHRGIGLFTGDVGCGKSTALRAACGSLGAQLYKTVYLHRGLDNGGAFYTQLALQLGQTPKFRKSDVAAQVLAAITDNYANQKIQTVIVIDEAHLLKPDLLDEIRLIHNTRFDSADCLATALVGQTPLRKTIDLNRFQPLKQRIGVMAHLGALTREQCYKYFEHQIALTKSSVKIFMDNAVETIVLASKGVPRVINNVALKSMTLAASEKMTSVDQTCVLKVLEELGLK